MPAGHAETIIVWTSKGLPNEIIKPTTANYSLSPKPRWHNSKMSVKFQGSCLKQDKVIFIPCTVVNLLIVYELNWWSQDLNTDFTLKDYLFGAVN